MFIKRHVFLFTAIAMNIASLSHAMEDEELLSSFGDEDFVSIATGQQQLISKAPAVATVITASQIKEMGATDLDQVLESVPGLHVSLSSTRYSPVYSMRGIHTDKNPQVLMLVNGTPMTQLYFGDRGGRSLLPVDSISRVEVIRGPGSAVYGADAFAGVINIITKTPQEMTGTKIGGSTGSFDSQRGWLLHGTQWGEVDVAFSMEYMKTEGDDDRVIDSDAQSLFDTLTGTTASLAPGSANTSEERYDARLELGLNNWKLRAWNWQQRHSGTGPGIALALDPAGESEVDNYLVDLVYANDSIAENWEMEAKLSYMDINTTSEQRVFPAGTLLPLGLDGNISPVSPLLGYFVDGFIGNPEVYEEHSRFDTSAFYSGIQDHTFRFATGFHYAELQGKETKNFGPGVLDMSSFLPFVPVVVDGTLTSVTNTPDIFIKEASRKVHYVSIQDEWLLATDWSLTAGVRYDDYSDFGTTTNPRAALVWNAQQNLTAKLLYGKAFRAPSFAELFAINNPVLTGNDSLDPEEIDTYEIAFDYRPSFDLRTSLNIFYYEIDDLIRFVAGPTGSVAQNTGEQTGYGFELEADWQLTETLSLSGHYAYQNSEDDEAHDDAGFAPEQKIYLNAKWDFKPNWYATTQVSWIAGRKRQPADPRSDLGDYTIVNMLVGANNLVNDVDIKIGIKNVFDEDADEPSPTEAVPTGAGSMIPNDFRLDGRNAFIEAEYKF